MGFFKKLFGGRQAESVPEGQRGDVILAFHTRMGKSIDWNQLQDVQYAMWLPAADDKNFSNSSLLKQWTEAYALTKFYWSYITADLLNTLQVTEGNPFRLSLPEDFRTFAFVTHEGYQVILSLSKEKGIRFHFAETTPIVYRASFMDSFIAYCHAWKGLVELNKGQPDDDTGFEGWWTTTVQASKGVELHEPLEAVGKVVIK